MRPPSSSGETFPRRGDFRPRARACPSAVSKIVFLITASTPRLPREPRDILQRLVHAERPQVRDLDRGVVNSPTGYSSRAPVPGSGLISPLAAEHLQVLPRAGRRGGFQMSPNLAPRCAGSPAG